MEIKIYNVVIALGFSSDLDDMTLLLKTPHIWIAKHREIKLD